MRLTIEASHYAARALCIAALVLTAAPAAYSHRRAERTSGACPGSRARDHCASPGTCDPDENGGVPSSTAAIASTAIPSSQMRTLYRRIGYQDKPTRLPTCVTQKPAD